MLRRSDYSENIAMTQDDDKDDRTTCPRLC